MLENKVLITEIKTIIASAKERAIRSVDSERVQMYWRIGKRIFEEEQQGKERAGYGEYLIKYLSDNLQPEYGSDIPYGSLTGIVNFTGLSQLCLHCGHNWAGVNSSFC